jgi:hypothetical protein
MEGFLKRHPELTVRVASLIKRGRARVSHNDVNEFFNRFEKVMEGVLPANIFNYDETAMQDNPGHILNSLLPTGSFTIYKL